MCILQVNKHKNASLDNLPIRKEQNQKTQHNQFSIMLDEELFAHDAKALMKCAEVLGMLVRDAAHITPYNFDSCVHTIRVFVEASMHNLAGNCSLLGYYGYHYLCNTDPSSGSRLWFPAEFVALYRFNTR